MTWTKGSDSAATHPDLMKIAGFDLDDDRLLNEVGGFVFRCYFQVARHRTDYAVDPGTAIAMGTSRWRELVAHAVRAGLMTPVEIDGVTHWQMKADPDFMHVPTRAELEWAAQRKRDLDNPRIYVQVRLRDGDNCRWCGIGVYWTGPKSDRAGELDHLNPGEPGTVETMVVACVRCNRGRGAVGPDVWDSQHTLREPPAKPTYGIHTAKVLSRNGWPTEPNHLSDDDGREPADADTARPDQAVRPAAPAARRPAPPKAAAAPARPKAVRPAAPAAADPAPPRATRSATPTPQSRRNRARVSDSQSPESGLVGSGRVGSGTPTTGAPPDTPTARLQATQPQDHPPRPRRRRGKRGGRPRPQGGTP